MVSSGPAQLDAISSDVRQAFTALQHSTPGHNSATYPRPPVEVSPGLGVSRDLLEATDYITGAVTSLVKELHSG